MKILSKISMFLVGAVALASCNGPQQTIVNPTAITPADITFVTEGPIVLDRSQPDGSQVTLKWAAASYGYQAAITYTVMARATVGEATVNVEVAQTTKLEAGLVTKALNGALVKQLNADPGAEFTAEFYVLSSIGASQYDTVSTLRPITITPYSMDPVPMWLAGAYCGWHPDAPAETKATKIYSELANGIYTGWVSIVESGKAIDEMTQFKFTTHPNWSGPNYGGTLNALLFEGDPANLQIPNGHVNYFTLNVPKLKATIDKKFQKLAIIGNACPGDWRVDNELAYDFETNTFRAKLAMTSGEFKFRADGAWDIQWGPSGTPGTLIRAGGSINKDNLLFDQAPGEYTVIVRLFDDYPTYEFIAE